MADDVLAAILGAVAGGSVGGNLLDQALSYAGMQIPVVPGVLSVQDLIQVGLGITLVVFGVPFLRYFGAGVLAYEVGIITSEQVHIVGLTYMPRLTRMGNMR